MTKWYPFVAPVLAFLVVLGVDYNASIYRDRSVYEENVRDFELNWHQTARAIEFGGLDGLAIEKQEQWETVDIYVVNADGTFATVPRFWPTAIEDGLRAASNYGALLGSDSVPADTSTVETIDYRGERVLRAGGQVMVDGDRRVLLVEMDIAEMQALWNPWYQGGDEWGVGLIALIALLVEAYRRRGSATLKGAGSREERTLLKVGVENADAKICIARPDGSIIAMSYQFAEFLEYPHSEASAMNVDQFHPDPQVHRDLRDRMDTAEIVDRPVEISTKMGRSVHFHLGVRKAWTPYGTVQVATGRDVVGEQSRRSDS